MRQIFDDPAGDHDWGFSAVVDLAASDEAGEAVLTVTDIGQLGSDGQQDTMHQGAGEGAEYQG